MKLLPEQMESLTEKLEKLVIQYNNLKEIKKSENKSATISSEGFSDQTTNYLASEVKDMRHEIDKLRELLEKSIVVEEVNSSEIEIGSEFVATIDFFGEEETETYVLVEHFERICGAHIVSINSPLGSAVLGKKSNETFAYSANNRDFKGYINKVNGKPEKQKTIVK